MSFELLAILTDYANWKKGGWNYWANLNQTLLKWSLGGPLSKLCPSPVSKMAAINKHRNFFKWPKLLYFKPESAQIWTE